MKIAPLPAFAVLLVSFMTQRAWPSWPRHQQQIMDLNGEYTYFNYFLKGFKPVVSSLQIIYYIVLCNV